MSRQGGWELTNGDAGGSVPHIMTLYWEVMDRLSIGSDGDARRREMLPVFPPVRERYRVLSPL